MRLLRQMTLTERLLAEKLYEKLRGQDNRNYAHGHSFEEWLDHQMNYPLPGVERTKTSARSLLT